MLFARSAEERIGKSRLQQRERFVPLLGLPLTKPYVVVELIPANERVLVRGGKEQ